MKPFFVCDHIATCKTPEGVVLLDLKKQRYFGLDDLQASLLGIVVNDWPCKPPPNATDAYCASDAEQLANELSANNVLSKFPPGASDTKPLTIARNAVSHADVLDSGSMLTIKHLVAFFASYLIASVLLRFRTLEQIKRRVVDRKSRHISSSNKTPRYSTDQLSAVFRRLRPLIYTSADHCLFDSLALLEFLALHRYFPNWVIGVRTQPFGAHSWLQNEATVLNDDVEHVQFFTAIAHF